MDYRKINEITVKDRTPLPLINDSLDRLSKAKIYTKIDLKAAYSRIRIKDGDEWKTAFRTRYGHFQYNILPFGLTNAPATFQRYINDVLREDLDQGCIAYLGDINIYSDSLEELILLVRQILKKLLNARLYANIAKTTFHTTETTFLGYIISTDGVKADPAKIQSIPDWKPPRNIKDVQAFLEFANFYHRFVKNYSHEALPLTKLTKKDTKFEWGDAQE